MAMKEQQRPVYRSMQGKEVDMHKLMMVNEMTPAVGNMKVNARGDELGPGGKIVRRREEFVQAGSTPEQRYAATVEETSVPTPVKAAPVKKEIDDDPTGGV